MSELHARYDRRADVLYLYIDANAASTAREDERGIVWRFRDDQRPVGATIIDFHEIWDGRMQELANALAEQFHMPARRAAKTLATVGA